MTATEVHSAASMDKSVFGDGWLEDSMVASKLGLLMWSTDKVHREKLDDQLSIMEQMPHENPVLAAKGHMQYKWLRAKMREQDIVSKRIWRSRHKWLWKLARTLRTWWCK